MGVRARAAAAGRAVAGLVGGARFGAVLVAVALGCGDGGADPLSEHGLFIDPVAQLPAADVIPFDVNSILYADGSRKLRFLRLPAGARIGYRDEGPWQLPEGSVVVKTFYYPLDLRDPMAGRRLLETRLLIREAGSWTPRTFVWNEAQTGTREVVAGQTIPVRYVDDRGETVSIDYRVPNTNDCQACHANADVMQLLGVRTRQLHRMFDYGEGPVDQIDHLVELGVLEGEVPAAAERALLPPVDGPADLEARARSYLDANCAHCHQPGGGAGSSGLDLRFETDSPSSVGICKRPVAAGHANGGHRYDIFPGRPDESIVVFRMSSLEPEIKMPEIGTTTLHRRGIELVSEWIAAMELAPCD